MDLDFGLLLTTQGLFYVFVLTLLEIVLGIDNIIFISIVTDNLEKREQRKARNIGLTLALVIRLLLLSIVGYIMGMVEPLFTIFEVDFSGQSLVLLLGGMFLIYKSTVEMHKSITGEQDTHVSSKKKGLSNIIIQILLIDIVFSFDSIITAIGMTNGIAQDTGGNPLIIIYTAVIISMIVMMVFVKPISDFISARPTIKMIALAFLVTIGVILIAEAFGQHVPKGYIYFAMLYALIVEFMNIKMRKNGGVKE
ncbi:MAG: putative tellurium resistance membrane protein TerC [Lentimonas sp.]|jgi:predicted tellurium resistance membrane protein TerC